MILLIPVLFALCLSLLVGLSVFVYRKSPASWLHRYFALVCLGLVFWLSSLFVFDRESEPTLLTALGRLNFASILVVVLCGYLFVREITRKPSPYGKLLLAETLLLVMLTLFTPLIDQREFVKSGEHITGFGPLFFLVVAHLLLYYAAMIYTAFAEARQASREVHRQLAIIGVGIAVSAVSGLITNLLLPFLFHIFAFQEVGSLAVIFFIGAVAYAITTHHLFDIRILIRRTVVFALLLAFVLAVYSGVVLFLAQSLPFAESTSTARDLLTIAAIVVIALSFDPLRRLLEEKTDRFLFRKEYAQQQVLSTLASQLTEVVESEQALPLILKTLKEALHLKAAVMFVFEPGEQGGLAIKKVHQIGYPATARLFVKELDSVGAYFTGQRAPIYLKTALSPTEPSAIRLDSPACQALLHKLYSLGFAIALPLHLGSTLAGLLLLGEKRSGGAFSERDLELIAATGTQTLSSLQKARLFESDQSKTELVSIASHELLTPLTAVQGYLSMVLDEHLGKVDAQAEGYLSKAYQGVERLSHLVKDLLSASRLEAGRLKIEPQAIDSVSLIQSVVDQLTPVAKKKKLILRFEHPDETLPSVWADPDRVQEVLVNLVSNSVKYTPEGSVNVAVRLIESGEKKLVEIEVSDTGVGIDSQAQEHLFEKFYRVADPKTAGVSGTGLGLYITKQMVETMSGTIALKSRKGEGSTFLVRLPVLSASTERR